MNTNALLTDLTPQQEEKVTGGLDPITLSIGAAIIAGSLTGGAVWGRWRRWW